VRFNLDPLGLYNDIEISHVLEQCGIMKTFRQDSDIYKLLYDTNDDIRNVRLIYIDIHVYSLIYIIITY
jgi:hypothetical protein